MSDTLPEPEHNPQPQQPIPDSLGNAADSPVSNPDPITNSPEPNLQSPPKKQPKAKIKLISLIVLVLVIIGAVVGYLIHHNQQSATSNKKDIPYLTYGNYGYGNIAPNYPTESSDDNGTISVDTQIFEGLVGFKNQTKIVPLLATSWYNPNDSTWIFNLRHGVKFHSGRTMTAADVKYSLDYEVAHQSTFGSDSTVLAEASTIKSVSVINPYQVKITTNGPDPVLLSKLAGALFIFDSKAKLGSPNSGTGPYEVKPGGITSNGSSIDLIAFNNYWGGHVYTREVRYLTYSTASQLVSAVKSGKVDLAGDFTNQQFSQIKSSVKNVQQINVPDTGVSYLQLNVEKPNSPLYSVAARQAITYALNIPAILKAGDINGTQANQVIPSTLPGYDPSIKNTAYDPAKAKQLLATVPNASAPLNLVFAVGDENEVAEIAKELNAVGFNIKTSDESDFGTFINMLVAGQGDMFFLSYSTPTLDGVDMINSTVLGTQNYNSTELSGLVSQASSEFNPTQRINILQKSEQLIAKDIPSVALYTSIRTYTLTKPYVINVSVPADDIGTYFWQVYQK